MALIPRLIKSIQSIFSPKKRRKRVKKIVNKKKSSSRRKPSKKKSKRPVKKKQAASKQKIKRPAARKKKAKNPAAAKKKRPPVKKKRAVRKRVKKRKSVKKKVKRTVFKKAAKRQKPSGALAGEVTHFFTKIHVCVIKVSGGGFKVGDKLHFEGATTHFDQKVKSLQVESKDVPSARRGQLVGLKADKRVRAGDKVYKL